MSLVKLFFIFVKIGAILLGGGYVILPIMSEELTKKRSIITNDELLEYFALSQSLPGIIAANMSMFVGYKLKGTNGAIAAILGVTFAPFWIIVVLASFLNKMIFNPYVNSALWGVGVSVVALISLTAREMWQKSSKDKFFCFVFLSAFVAIMIFKLSPIQTIITFSFAGIVLKITERRGA